MDHASLPAAVQCLALAVALQPRGLAAADVAMLADLASGLVSRWPWHASCALLHQRFRLSAAYASCHRRLLACAASFSAP